MGSLTDFFQNSVAPPVPSTSTSSTSAPLWLSDFLYNTLSAASNLAQQPYPQYNGPLVAGPSSQTQQAWNLAGQNLNDYQPLLGQAASTISGAAQPINQGDISTFLNPFQNYVTGAIDRNLTQNILPQVQDKFVSAGQSRSPQEAQVTSNAIYDTQQAAGQALAQNYQGALSNLLQSRAQQLTGGAQLGQLGALTSQLGNANLGELAASGNAQDQLNQANVNAAYQQFQNQVNWPYQQVGFLSDVARGLPVAAAGSTTTGAGLQSPSVYGPSPLASLAGLYGSNAAFGGSTGPFAKGGHVKGALSSHYAHGGEVRKYAGGGASAPAAPAGPAGDNGFSNFISGLPSWASFIPGVTAIKSINDLANNPDANTTSDILGIGSIIPGPVGMGLGLGSSLAPGGALGNLFFGNPGTTTPGATTNTPNPMGGNPIPLSSPPITVGASPGIFSDAGAGSFFNDIGSGIGNFFDSIGSGISDFLGLGGGGGGLGLVDVSPAASISGADYGSGSSGDWVNLPSLEAIGNWLFGSHGGHVHRGALSHYAGGGEVAMDDDGSELTPTQSNEAMAAMRASASRTLPGGGMLTRSETYVPRPLLRSKTGTVMQPPMAPYPRPMQKPTGFARGGALTANCR